MLDNPRFMSLKIILFYAPFLFCGAGSLFWLEGWCFLICIIILNYFIVQHNDIHLLISRSFHVYKFPDCFWKTPSMCILILLSCLWLLSNGIDTVRYHITGIGSFLQCLGFIGTVLSLGCIYWIIEWNYSTAVIYRSQGKKKIKVFYLGPYSKIRHPMYLMSCILLPCASLMMASTLGLMVAFIFIIWMCIHTYFEDKMLQQHIEGYRIYAEKVPYRMIYYIF